MKLDKLSAYEKAVVVAYLRTLADRYDTFCGDIWATDDDRKNANAIQRTLAIVKKSDELSKSTSLTSALPEKMVSAIWDFELAK